MEKKRLETYTLLHSVALHQVATGKRSKAPTLFPAVVSTHGEFGTGMVHLQEWLTDKYRARVTREGERDDGQDADSLTAQFRTSFRAVMLLAVATGHASMMRNAGLPWAGAKSTMHQTVENISSSSDLSGSSGDTSNFDPTEPDISYQDESETCSISDEDQKSQSSLNTEESEQEHQHFLQTLNSQESNH